MSNFANLPKSTRCANCGCRRDDHFEGSGVCDLGFCRSRCSDFVAPFVEHNFGGIDGRCFGCDVRPGSRHAAESCLNY